MINNIDNFYKRKTKVFWGNSLFHFPFLQWYWTSKEQRTAYKMPVAPFHWERLAITAKSLGNYSMASFFVIFMLLSSYLSNYFLLVQKFNYFSWSLQERGRSQMYSNEYVTFNKKINKEIQCIVVSKYSVTVQFFHI